MFAIGRALLNTIKLIIFQFIGKLHSRHETEANSAYLIDFMRLAMQRNVAHYMIRCSTLQR